MQTYAEKNWGDCSQVVAYNLNFTQMCYSPGNVPRSEFYKVACNNCLREEQYKGFEYRKSDFSKKDYFILDYLCYGVSKELKDDMIAFGLNENNFRPIYTRKHDAVLGYQIVADNVLPDVTGVNGKYTFSECGVCHHRCYELQDELRATEAYGGLGYPVYLTEETYKEIQHINCLYEDHGDIIISCSLYDFLIKKYPRMECRPVFIGTVYEDREYLRLTNGK